MEKIFTAKTIDEAKEMAVLEFGVNASKITFNIIEEPKKSLFGKLKGEAVVNAQYVPSKVDFVSTFVKNMFLKMGVNNINVVGAEVETGIAIELHGENIDEYLGKRGEVLDAVQYLTSLVLNKGEKDYLRVNIDCNGFREKREKQLIELAKKICKTVAKTGRSSVLEPMNPYERRIIHSAVSEIEGVNSHSVGDEPYRKVVVSSTNKRPFKRDFKDRNDRPVKRSEKNTERNIQPKALDISTSFEKDYKKPRPDDAVGGGLYSKIDID